MILGQLKQLRRSLKKKVNGGLNQNCIQKNAQFLCIKNIMKIF